MNLLLLAIALRAWTGSALSIFLRIMGAVALFSIEMQIATVLDVGTIRSIRLVNLAAAALSTLGFAWRRSRQSDNEAPVGGALSTRGDRGAARLPPAAAVLGLAAVVTMVALVRPVAGADPYHLQRVDQITNTGTLTYDVSTADIKVNALAGVYELLLADLRIPGAATALVRFHGVLGLGLYVVAIAAVAGWLQLRRRWLLITLLVIPVVFHQLILVKNDLFGAVPALVALGWVVLRGREMSRGEVAAAAALAGFATGVKISSAAVALVVGGFVAFDHAADWRVLVVTFAAGVAGALGGGLFFTLAQNQIVYGGSMEPYAALGNRNQTAAEALVGVGRFATSLLDLGVVTRRVWPGRGGWGSTFGLPLIWACFVLVASWRERVTQRAVVAAAICFLVFAATYSDADVAHRMVIAPGALLVIVAVGYADRNQPRAHTMRRTLVPVLVASALQIGHSAMLYITQLP